MTSVPKRWRRAVVPAAILAGIVAPLLLLSAGLVPASVCLVSILLVMASVFWLLRPHVGALLLMFLSVALASTTISRPTLNVHSGVADDRDADAVVERWRESGPFNDELPIVVHLVLDEMVSTGAMDDTLPRGRETRDGLYAFAETYGLRTFDSIFSRRYYSGVAIPNMMNAEYEGRTDASQLESAIQEVVHENRYFRDMAQRGYRTAVFQTAVMDFCQTADVILCETFRSFDPSVGAKASQRLNERTLGLAETLFRVFEPGYISQLGLHVLSEGYGIGGRETRVHGAAGRFDPQGFAAWFSYFVRFLERVPRGSHVYAHFLVPHAPYLLSPTCLVEGTVSTGYSLASEVPDETRRPGVRLRHYDDYLRQVGCVQTKLGEMMKILMNVEAYRDATFVIHGDHGSRISNGNTIEDQRPQDFVDNYATYFAVKAPGLASGIDCEFTSLPQIFRRVMRPDDSVEMAPLRVIVATRAAENKRVEVVMPRFGCAASAPVVQGAE